MADQRSFADKVLDALESGEWMTWSELCEATGLTLFWVRESLDSLVEEGMVEVTGDAVFKFRLSDAQVSKALDDAGIDMAPAIARMRSMIAAHK